MSTEVYHRTTCRLCDSPEVEQVVDLEPIPLSENYTKNSEAGKQAVLYSVNLYMCRSCGHVQQLDVVDSKSLWAAYTYYSADAKGMPEHFAEVAKQFQEKYTPPVGALVVDVGSNDGSLLKPFRDAGFTVLGIDPATEIARAATDAGIPTIPELMSLDLAHRIRKEHGPAKAVFTFNAFAHADNLGEMTDGIREMLDADGVFIFEVQYLLDIIDRVLIATIFHEHMSHHSVKALVNFLDRHDLELIDIDRVPIQHGSLVGAVQRKGGPHAMSPSVQELLDVEERRQLDSIDTLRQFNRKLKKLRSDMRSLVAGWHDSGASVAGYGAARSGPTLIAQLSLKNTIDYIVDDHPQKVGLYSSGDGIPIVPTSTLLERQPDYTVILAWVHAQKIIESNGEYRARGGKFVVLCPESRIVSKDGDTEV